MAKYALPWTVGAVRDLVRQQAFNSVGEVFEALTFLLGEYDTVWQKYTQVQQPAEYRVIKHGQDQQSE